jgi:hypothetical protein
MRFDLFLVLGLAIIIISIPSIISAISERRSPRLIAIVLLIGGGLVGYAVTQKPGGYTLQEVPDAFLRVVAYFLK